MQTNLNKIPTGRDITWFCDQEFSQDLLKRSVTNCIKILINPVSAVLEKLIPHGSMLDIPCSSMYKAKMKKELFNKLSVLKT